jgi:hypothetical protein
MCGKDKTNDVYLTQTSSFQEARTLTPQVWFAVVFSLALAGPSLAASDLPPREAYVGSDACRECHAGEYDGWRASYHFSVVQNVKEQPDALLGDFSQAGLGITTDEIELAIGGHWYQRYAVRREGKLYVLPKAWSVASHRWETVDAWSWKKKPYARFCIGCHTTRYDPATRSYAEHTVGCEACHGPGRDHAESRGRSAILNPGDWDRDERDLICASCHVRGTDPSGRYYFPVGYLPGRELTDHYLPLRVADGETPRAAFLRDFRDGMARLGEGQPPTCEVCGIERERPLSKSNSTNQPCLECHKYGNDYASHTKHPGQPDLGCLDCHRKIEEIATASSADVHSPEFFRVHREIWYAPAEEPGCRKCHRDVPPRFLGEALRQWTMQITM